MRTHHAALPPDSLAFALLAAAQSVAAVIGGQSLADGLLQKAPAAVRPAVQDLVYGTLRQFGRGDFLLARLLQKPLSLTEVRALLLTALFRLQQRPETAHTVVDQAVAAAATLAGGRFKNLVNAVLRNFLRQRETLEAAIAADAVASTQHPAWWLDRLRQDWPQQCAAIIAADNGQAPMALRVNRRRLTRDAWLSEMALAGISGQASGADGVLLDKPQPVERLPGFAAGLVSVQDLGAQRAAPLLAPQPGSRVLDACAAPGGKTAHLLELADLDLVALDLKAARCRRIEDNLSRLGLSATVKVADCIDTKNWWDGRPFDAILADVPCTASGVVRRHPDAKWLRRESDIASFAATQARLLDALWPLLRGGGKLLYVTCSLFAAENSEQMRDFLRRHPDAGRIDEIQLLPDAEHDGFYYCLLHKAQ